MDLERDKLEQQKMKMEMEHEKRKMELERDQMDLEKKKIEHQQTTQEVANMLMGPGNGLDTSKVNSLGVGGGWKKVRHTKPGNCWNPASDQLVGS